MSPLIVANLQHFGPGGAATRAADDKQTRYAVVLARQQPLVAFQAFALKHLGICMRGPGLVEAPPALLNQAIIAQEDVGIRCSSPGQFHYCCGSGPPARCSAGVIVWSLGPLGLRADFALAGLFTFMIGKKEKNYIRLSSPKGMMRQ